MKNLLIATTALVATAGFAAADVTFSGAANFGVINTGGTAAVAAVAATATTNAVVAANAVPAGDTVMYNNVSVTAAMSGETDGGLTFGSSLTFRSGDDVDLDVGDITNAGALGATSLGNIYVSGDFGKLTFDANGVDNAHNDDFSHDVMYNGTFGALAVTVTANVEDGTTADGEDFSAKVVYSASGITVTAATDDSGESDTTLAYVLNDMITASLNYDTNGQTTAETIVKVAYSNAGVTAHLALADDDDDQWELGLGYTANGMSIAAVFAENDGDATTTDEEMDITASYDLGGGMTMNAAYNESGAFFIGSKMSF